MKLLWRVLGSRPAAIRAAPKVLQPCHDLPVSVTVDQAVEEPSTLMISSKVRTDAMDAPLMSADKLHEQGELTHTYSYSYTMSCWDYLSWRLSSIMLATGICQPRVAMNARVSPPKHASSHSL